MNFQDLVNNILPPVTDSEGNTYNGGTTYTGKDRNDFLSWRPKRSDWHNGTDISYRSPDDPQSSAPNINNGNPDVGSPVGGKVSGKGTDWIEIQDAFGYKHRLTHLVDIDPSLKEGDMVDAKQVLGKMGNTPGGPHVDYKIKDPNGNYIDPECWAIESLRYYLENIMKTKRSPWNAGKRTPIPPVRGCDPLAMDLDRDGIETTAVNNGAFFDHDANGFAEQTGWASSDDGLLVMDRNNDGIINNGTELFGDQTILSNGNKATDGFQALAELDSNTDGKIDSTDTAYSQLRVWQDYDEDGYSTEEELLTLDQAGIQSINLQSETTNITDTEGNTKTKQGTFEFTDGTTGEISNYNLKTDMAYTIAKELIEVPEDIASLPDIQGYGTMYDLHQAMARERLAGSETLKGLVEQFTAATDVTARNILMEQILFRWVGAEGIDPNSRGRVVDARKMAVMDNVFGSTYRGTTGPNPHQWAAPFLFQTFGNQPIS